MSEKNEKKQTSNKRVTNADRIRSMTDEELAEYFSDLIRDTQEYEYCENSSDWLKWLKKENKIIV